GSAWYCLRHLEGSWRIRVASLSSTWRRIDSISDGCFDTRIDLGVFRSSDGSDGRSRWRKEPSGGVHSLDGTFAKSATKTEAWLAQRGWLSRNADGAAIGPPASRDEDGRSYVVVEATPPGGQPVELWLDAKTGLLDRALRT